MDVGALFVTNAQAAKLIKPSKGSFYYPPPSTQSTAMLSVSLGEPRQNVAGTETASDRLGVITPVA